MRRAVGSLAFVFTLTACTADEQDTPTTAAPEPEVVQAGVISLDERNETFPAIDPVDGSLWFSVYERSFDAQTIMVARPAEGGAWAAAEVAPFSGTHGDRAPRFAPGGLRLYFTSNRPVPGHPDGDMNVWVVDRRGDGGGWSAPRLVPPPVSVPDGRDIHPSVLADGTVFVASNRPGGSGRSDIWRIPGSGAGDAPAERLPEAINDSLSQPDLYVHPDGIWMILVATDRSGGLGGDDLWFSRFDGVWNAPEHLGAGINSAEYEYGPSLSPDGEWLYFTSHRRGTADVWRIRATVLPLPSEPTTTGG